MPRPTIRVATAHLSPSLLSPSDTLTTILTTIHHAATHHATLICFPESFLPGFPIWSALLPPAHAATHVFFAAFAEASVYADGPEVTAIRQAARECGISVSLGFSEKARWSQGTLWNSNLIIDQSGEVRVHHRKLQPTFYERLSWGMGDGKGLETVGVGVVAIPKQEGAAHRPQGGSAGVDAGAAAEVANTGIENNAARPTKQASPSTTSPAAETVKIGALICGENTNPLARYSLIGQGEDVHISSWPAVWPTRLTPADPPSPSSTPGTTTTTAAAPSAQPHPKGKNYDNILANRLRAGAHCFEAKCFGIMCAAALSESNISMLLDFFTSASAPASPTSDSLSAFDEELLASFERTLRSTSRAASMVLDPTGTPVMGFVVDETGEKVEMEMLREQEGVLFTDLDLSAGVEGKQYHDLVGGYQRGDVFELRVGRGRREVVRFEDLA